MTKSEVIKKIKEIRRGDVVSEQAGFHLAPEPGEEVNVMAVEIPRDGFHWLDELQKAGAFEAWEDFSKTAGMPSVNIYNIDRSFWE